MKLSILYRGTLSSCNYGCDYCPFAKHNETAEEHAADAHDLARFVEWVCQRDKDKISVFFTPWGEALIHRRYQQAFIDLTNLPHVEKVTIQTNLSCQLDWVEHCDKSKMALWTTYHPTEISRERFLTRCDELEQRQIKYSVGIVGMKDHLSEIAALRDALPDHVYLWVNAYKRIPDYYSEAEREQIIAVDPLFQMNNQRHPSKGKACLTGEQVISVRGDGTVWRCHFIKAPIGNIYRDDFDACLRPRPCTNDTCGCHIGYVHMPHLALDKVFGDGILERIPIENSWSV